MSDPIFRRIALAASILALMTGVAAIGILLCKWMGISGAAITTVATGAMIATLGLQIAFVAVQAFQNGRQPIALRGMGPDAWFTVLVITAIPGVAWSSLAALALPPMQLLLPNPVTPLVNVLLLIVFRELRQRRARGVHA